MPIEIRPAREDELERAHFVIAYSFTADRTEEGRERMRHVEEMAPSTVLLEDGEIVACLRVFPLEVLVNGAPVPLGGVSSVACLPEHRRKGHIGRLLRHSLSEMRERGQALSSLYTPHPALYRRSGWMVAGSALKHTWNPKQVRLHHGHAPSGRAVRVAEEDRPLLEDLYQRFTAGRNGYLVRPERWWKEAVFRRLYDEQRTLNDIAVWRKDSGEASGYVAYRSSRERSLGGAPVDHIFVAEFVALDGDAYSGLLRYLLSHDLAADITWYGPPDEPLAFAVEDSERVHREYHDTFMLRVVDVEKAVAARPAASGAPDGAFTVHIADAAAPWNQGTWRIECSGGALRAVRTDEPANMSTDAATFAALYNGFMRATEAARCGLAEVSDPAAAALADRVLAADYAPYSSDFFWAAPRASVVGAQNDSPRTFGIAQRLALPPWNTSPAAVARRAVGRARMTAKPTWRAMNDRRNAAARQPIVVAFWMG